MYVNKSNKLKNEKIKKKDIEEQVLQFARKGARREAKPRGDGQGLASSNTPHTHAPTYAYVWCVWYTYLSTPLHPHTHSMLGCCKITSITVSIWYGMYWAPPKPLYHPPKRLDFC